MVAIDFAFKEDDGAAWFEDGKIVVNLRWLSFDWEAVDYIVSCIIHEYLEHVLGLGHELAMYAEKAIISLLKGLEKPIASITSVGGRRVAELKA